MSERPELPPARRRRTAATICQYLGVEPTANRIKLLSDVLLAGELDFVIACHRHGEITKQMTGYKGWWEALIVGLKNKLNELAYLKDAFSIYPEVSEAILKDVVNDPALPLGDSNDVPVAKEND
ncbi:MAG: hypothetical protein PHS57_08760 [Alphaproteobacteria bacterium]|nr:hypothetical protein [Alphaproteobacteria bacterium]